MDYQHPNNSAFINSPYVAGAFTGVIKTLSSYWMETIKIRMQTDKFYQMGHHGPRYCFNSIWMNEGIMGFYKGSSLSFVTNMGLTAIEFGVFKEVRERTNSVVVGGIAAGTVQSITITPLDHLRIKVQADKSKNSWPRILENMYRKKGLNGLYLGFNISMMKNVPDTVIYFWLYDKLINATNSRWSNEKSKTSIALSGGLAGVGSNLAVYPFDLIKSNIHKFGNPNASEVEQILSVGRTVFHKYSVRGVYTGIGPSLAQSFFVNAILFSVFEQVCGI